MSNTETLFSVTFTWEPTAWGENLTARLVNPDGSTLVDEVFTYGPNGMSLGDEDQVAEWVGVQAEEAVETFFSAIAEQASQYRNWRP